MKLKGLLVLIAMLCLVGVVSAQWAVVNTTAGWMPKWYHSSVALPDGTIILMGGDDTLGNATNDVWNSTDDGATWTQLPNAGWSAREHSTAVALPNGHIVIMGGETRIGLGGGTLNETWRSTDNGTSWTQMNASSGWAKKSYASSVALSDGSIVLMGGYDNYRSYNDTWLSTDEGATWTQQTADAGWPGRYGMSAVTFPSPYSSAYNNIVLMGGSDGANVYNDTWLSIDNGTTWSQQNASSGWSARQQQSGVVLIDDSIFLFGGTGGGENDEWKSTDYGATWDFVTLTPWGSSIYGQSAVWDPNTRITVMTGGWGGYNVPVYNNNFYPAITSITPTNGTASGGTVVNITGSGFTGASVALFGSTYATGLVVISDTEASAISPAGTGTVNVRIATTISTSPTSASDLFTYDPLPPVVTSISPTYGSESGGTAVNITGSGFTGASSIYLSVLFGTIPGSGNVFISDTEISSVSPPGTGSVHITVETPNGTSAATTADLFTYGAAPPSQNTWWTPHTVQVTVLDANYGTRLYDVGIQAHYNETSMPSNWITDLYGVGSTVRADMVNQTLIMNGNTGSAGTVTFTMLGSIKYDFTLNSAQYGISDYTVMEWPSDNMLNIYVLTAGSLLPTQRNSTYTNLNGTRVYFTEPDINNVSMCIDYIDTSGETSSVTFLWKFTNGTLLNTSTVNPGTGLNTICNVTRNIRGTQIYWGFNATRSVVTV